MGDTRPRAWEADGNSRDSKTPRLDLLAEAAAAAEVNDLLDWEGCPEPTSEDDRCSHVPTDSAHKEILSSSLLSDDAGKCEDCRREEGPGKRRPEYSRIMVCLECGRQSCGDSTSYLPYGHARDHAQQEQHWVAALFDDPQTGFCFKCESEGPVYPEPDEMDMTGEIQQPASGHAFGFEMPQDLARGLLNLGEAWRAAEMGSASVQGYAIRGMPNRGNTCYVNAMVQCLLVLDKLRARMLGPDPPLGHLGMALKELFVETSAADAAGGLLNPDKLLRSVRSHADKYEAYRMQDSYELLESLRNALHDEEIGIEAPYRQKGAPTVIDSIFRGELSNTLSCIYCKSSSVFYDPFCELSLSLPSRSVASPETTKTLKSQPNKASTQLPSANGINLGKIQATAKSGDSHLLGLELNDLIVEKTPEPSEVDSAEAQHIWEKFVVQDRLKAPEDKDSELSQEFMGVPHNVSDIRFEQKPTIDTESSSPEVMASCPLVAGLSEKDAHRLSSSYVDQNDRNDSGDLFVATIEDCLSLFFKEEVVERSCDCSRVPEEPSNNHNENSEQMVANTNGEIATDGSQTEQSDRITCLDEWSNELNNLSVESKSSCSQQNSSVGESENQIGDNQNGLKETSGRAIQRPRVTKLPPILTLHLKRYTKDGNEYHKNEAQVSYKEYLDVRQFMDSSPMDKNNSIYRLAGFVEHRGGPSMNAGHYVAYVRARRLGNPQQQSRGSSSWFCADDCIIREVSLEEVLRRKPYVLFYERMEGEDMPSLRYGNSSK